MTTKIDSKTHALECLRQGFKTVRSIIFDVVADFENLSVAREITRVTFHLFGRKGEFIARVTQEKPIAAGGAVVGFYGNQLDSNDKFLSQNLIAQMKVWLEPLETQTQIASIVLTLSQRVPTSESEDTEAPKPFSVSTVLRVEVATFFPEESMSFDSSSSSLELTLGTFDAQADRFIRDDIERETSEIVAAIVTNDITPLGLKPLSPSFSRYCHWSILPIRLVKPLVSPKQLTEIIATDVLSNLNNPKSDMVGELIPIDDLIDEVANLQKTEEASLTKESEYDNEETEGSLEQEEKRSENENASHAITQPRMQLRKHPDETSQDSSENMKKSWLKNQAAIAKNMATTIDMLKQGSKDFQELAERIYSTPWKPQETQNLQPRPKQPKEHPAVCIDPNVAHLDDLNILKKDIKAEVLDTLEAYALKKDIGDFSITSDTKSQLLASVQRDLQRVQQKQAELDLVIQGLCECIINNNNLGRNTATESKSQRKENMNSGSTDIFETSTAALSLKNIKDPLVCSFLKFMRGLEIASQLTGSSFRELQTNLHYPEAFKELASGTSYPQARKLLEFISSKKATNLVQDIETVVGALRAGGTSASCDQFQNGNMGMRYFSNKPWWPSRPFVYE